MGGASGLRSTKRLTDFHKPHLASKSPLGETPAHWAMALFYRQRVCGQTDACKIAQEIQPGK